YGAGTSVFRAVKSAGFRGYHFTVSSLIKSPGSKVSHVLLAGLHIGSQLGGWRDVPELGPLLPVSNRGHCLNDGGGPKRLKGGGVCVWLLFELLLKMEGVLSFGTSPKDGDLGQRDSFVLV